MKGRKKHRVHVLIIDILVSKKRPLYWRWSEVGRCRAKGPVKALLSRSYALSSGERQNNNLRKSNPASYSSSFPYYTSQPHPSRGISVKLIEQIRVHRLRVFYARMASEVAAACHIHSWRLTAFCVVKAERRAGWFEYNGAFIALRNGRMARIRDVLSTSVSMSCKCVRWSALLFGVKF